MPFPMDEITIITLNPPNGGMILSKNLQGMPGPVGPQGPPGAGFDLTLPDPTTLRGLALWGNTTGTSLLNSTITASSNGDLNIPSDLAVTGTTNLNNLFTNNINHLTITDTGGGTLSINNSATLEVTNSATISGTNTGDQDLSHLVPETRTINGYELTQNINLTATDVGLGTIDGGSSSG